MTAKEVIAEALRVDADDPVDSWSREVWPYRAGVALQALRDSACVVVGVEDLVAVLLKHRWHRPNVTGMHRTACYCGWFTEIVNTHKTGIRLHAEHVAAMAAEAGHE